MKTGRYRFGDFEFDSQTLELFRGEHLLRLQRQPAQVLRVLLGRPGELVTRQDIQDQIWGGDRHVDVDRSVAYCLRQIRVALGDDPRAPRYVETLRGLGYRFVGSLDDPLPSTSASAVHASDRAPVAYRHRGWRGAAACLAAVAVLLAAGDSLPTVSKSPDHVGQDVMMRRAAEYMRRGGVDDFRSAAIVYRRVLSLTPASPRALAGLAVAEGELAQHHRDPRAAQAALLKAIEAARLAPRDPDVLIALARSQQAAGRLVDAAAAYQVAMRAAPDRVDLLDDMARLAYQRGRLDEAVRILTRRWRTTEPDPVPAGLFGVVLSGLGFDAAARGWLRLAEDLAPDGVQAKYWEGLAAYRAGRLDDAHHALAPLLAAADPGAHVVSLASLVLAKRRGPDAALPALAAAAASVPDDSGARMLLADVYRSLGRDEDARRERARVIETCERGAADAPQSAAWPRCLAAQLAVAGEHERAVFWYDRAVQLGWRNLAADRADGWIALLAGDTRFRAAQAFIARDIARMRAAVERDGVPTAPAIY